MLDMFSNAEDMLFRLSISVLYSHVSYLKRRINKSDLSKQQKDEQNFCHVRYATTYYQNFMFSRGEHSSLLADATAYEMHERTDQELVLPGL